MNQARNLFAGLTSLAPSIAASIEGAVADAIERELDRDSIIDSRRSRPLLAWDYLWEGVHPQFVTAESLTEFVRRAGECWMIADHQRGKAWRVVPNRAIHFKREDVYLIPCDDPTVCYASPHELDFGPFLIPLNGEESRIFREMSGFDPEPAEK